jgi:hypothetical protein
MLVASSRTILDRPNVIPILLSMLPAIIINSTTIIMAV